MIITAHGLAHRRLQGRRHHKHSVDQKKPEFFDGSNESQKTDDSGEDYNNIKNLILWILCGLGKKKVFKHCL